MLDMDLYLLVRLRFWVIDTISEDCATEVLPFVRSITFAASAVKFVEVSTTHTTHVITLILHNENGRILIRSAPFFV